MWKYDPKSIVQQFFMQLGMFVAIIGVIGLLLILPWGRSDGAETKSFRIPLVYGPRLYDRDPSLPADLPFSSAVVVGDTIYLAGEIGRKPGTVELVEGGVGPETTAIFENYKLTLARVGASLDDIVKCTVFLDDMSTFAEMNAAYVKFFPEEKPARSTFGVDGLALGASLEIECLAVKK